MKKSDILQAVIKKMEADLRRLQSANEDASAGATHSEARAETKWDTCGLESSYLARGHAQQFKALAADVVELRSFTVPVCTGRPIGPGALVNVEQNGTGMLFLVLPCGGGEEIRLDGQEINVITPESPVGTALIGKSAGEMYSFRKGMSGTILSVS